MGRDLQGKAQAFMLLFGAVFALGTLLTGWLAAEEVRLVAALQTRGIAAQGEVFDYVRERPSGTGLRGMGPDKFIPLIRWQTVQGQPATIKMNALKEQFPPGQYPLLYLADDPETARVESFTTMWLWTCILGGCTVLMLLVTAILLRASRRIG